MTVCQGGGGVCGREAQTLVGFHEVWGWGGHLWEGLRRHGGEVRGGRGGQRGARERREGGETRRAVPGGGGRGLPVVLFD